MENKKKANLIKGTLVAGVLLSSSVLSATPNNSNIFEYNTLGSGAEEKSEIVSSYFEGMKNQKAK